jgi:hypothetical protein
MNLAIGNLVPDAFVVIEKDQLNNERDYGERRATTEVAEHRVGQSEANHVAERLPGDRLYNGPFWFAWIGFHVNGFGKNTNGCADQSPGRGRCV